MPPMSRSGQRYQRSSMPATRRPAIARSLGQAERAWPFAVATVLLAGCYLLGGASRADVPQLLVLRPLAIGLAAVTLMFAPRLDGRGVRGPAILLGAMALLVAAQLVPLPWAIWTALPGRADAVAAMRLIHRDGDWHALSLMPDQTINALLSLMVPAAVTIVMAALPARGRARLLPVLMIAVLVDLLLGFVQLLTGSSGALRPFAVTNVTGAVGLFANRNHSAAMLAAGLPMTAAMAVAWTRAHRRRRLAVLALAAVTAFLLAFAILSIGSRAGLVLALIGGVFAGLILWPDLVEMTRGAGRWARRGLIVAPAVALAGLVVVAIIGARDESLRRLADPTLYADARIQAAPTVMLMIGRLMPFGSGFGTFSGVYRGVEPSDVLSSQYLNHAHNDYLEILTDGGVAAGLCLLAFAWWLAGQLAAARRRSDAVDRPQALMATAIILIALVASAFDYPMRTPVWMALFTVAVIWLGDAASGASVKTGSAASDTHASASVTDGRDRAGAVE